MFNGTQKRWKTVVSKEHSGMTRCFAILEIVCFYVSMATIAIMAVQLVFSKACGYEMPDVAEGMLKILLAAAVGFLTNWLAIEMLFHPYEYKRWLFIWPQGLVPRNKTEIGVKAGEKIASELLSPEEISRHLCAVASDFVQSEKFKKDISERTRSLLKQHENSIVGYLIPEIEASLVRIIRQNITPEKFRQLWETEIEPRLRSEETKIFVSERIIASIKKYSPELIDHIREWFRDYVYQYVDKNIGGIFNVLGVDTPRVFTDGLVDFIDWDSAEKMIHQKLDSPQTASSIKTVLTHYVEDFQKWMNSGESDEKTDVWVKEIQEKTHELLKSYLQTEILKMAGSILMSPKLWIWINEDFLPTIQSQLETLILERTPEVLSHVNFQEIISDAIEKQDTVAFHQMVNDVAAEHLGAIQILGFLLGCIIGILQIGI
ncbi:MAG: DUF445 family protein [Planctomycetia bacterium]|nr:DUF445 family protein [Planctomycetia bacterium]